MMQEIHTCWCVVFAVRRLPADSNDECFCLCINRTHALMLLACSMQEIICSVFPEDTPDSSSVETLPCKGDVMLRT